MLWPLGEIARCGLDEVNTMATPFTSGEKESVTMSIFMNRRRLKSLHYSKHQIALPPT